MNAKPRIILCALIIISVAVCLFSAALEAGYKHPIQVADSKGHQLGFNNSLTWELCGILLKSASLKTVATTLGFYGGFYLVAHGISFYLLRRRGSQTATRATANWFWLQLLFFPLGWFGILLLPEFFRSLVKGQIDGETISDFPFWWTFQPLWFAVSLSAGILICKRLKAASLSAAQ